MNNILEIILFSIVIGFVVWFLTYKISKKIILLFIVLSVFVIIYEYINIQIPWYRIWVKKNAIDDFKACMMFQKEKAGENYCLDYAIGEQYSPYPLYKAMILKNPNY